MKEAHRSNVFKTTNFPSRRLKHTRPSRAGDFCILCPACSGRGRWPRTRTAPMTARWITIPSPAQDAATF